MRPVYRLALLMMLGLMNVSFAVAQGQVAESGDREEDTVYYRRLVKVKNASDERATVSVQYRTFQADQGKWVWLPEGAPQIGAAETFIIQPGEELVLTNLNGPISASRIRISGESDNLFWNMHREVDLWVVPEVEDGEHRYKAGAMETHTYFLMGLESPPLMNEQGEPALPRGVVEQPRNSTFEFGQQKVVLARPDFEAPLPDAFVPERQAVLDPFPPIPVPALEPGMVLVREADLAVADFRVDSLSGSFTGTIENLGPQTYRGGRRWSVMRKRGPGGLYETVLQGWISPLAAGGRFRVWGNVTGLGQGNRFLFALSAGDTNLANDAAGLSLAPPPRADLAITGLRLLGNEAIVDVTNRGPGNYLGTSRSVTVADQHQVMMTTRSRPVGPLAEGETTTITFRVRPNSAPNNTLMARLNIGDRNLANDFSDVRVDPQAPLGRLADVRVDRIELDGRTLRGIVTSRQDGLPGGFRQLLLSYETLGSFPRRNLVSASLNPLATGASQEVTLRLPFDPSTTSFRASLAIQPSGADGDPTNDFKTRLFSVGSSPARAFDLAVGSMTRFGGTVVASVSNVGTDTFPGVGTWSLDAMASGRIIGQLGKGTINTLTPAQSLPLRVPVIVPAGTTDLRLSVAVPDINPNNNTTFIPVSDAVPQLAITNLRQNGSQLLWSFTQSPPTGSLQGQWSYELFVNNTRFANNPQVIPGPVAINLNTSSGNATVRLYNRLGAQRQLIDTQTLSLGSTGGGGGKGGGGKAGLTITRLAQTGTTISWKLEAPPSSNLVGAWTYDILLDNNTLATGRSANAGFATFSLPLPAGGPPPSGTLTINLYQAFGLSGTRSLRDSQSLQLTGTGGGGKGGGRLGGLSINNPIQNGRTVTWTFNDQSLPPSGKLVGVWTYDVVVNNTPVATALSATAGSASFSLPTTGSGTIPTGTLTINLYQAFGMGTTRTLRDNKSIQLTAVGKGGGAGGLILSKLTQNGGTISWTSNQSPPGSPVLGAWTYDVLFNNQPIATSLTANAGPANFALPITTPGAFSSGTLTINLYQSFGLGKNRNLRDSQSIQLAGTGGGGKGGGKSVAGDFAIGQLTQSGATISWQFVQTVPGNVVGSWTYDVLVDNNPLATSRPAQAGLENFQLPTAPGGPALTGTLKINLYQALGRGNPRALRDTQSLRLTGSGKGGGKGGGFGSLKVARLSQNGSTINWAFDSSPPNSNPAGTWTYDVLINKNTIATNRPAGAGPTSFQLPSATGGGGLPAGVLTVNVYQEAAPGSPRTLRDSSSIQLGSGGKGGGGGGGNPRVSVTVVNARIENNFLKWTFSISPSGAPLTGSWRYQILLDGQSSGVLSGRGVIQPTDIGRQFERNVPRGRNIQISVEEYGPGQTLLRRSEFPSVPLKAP